jgi:acyl dehydratase
MIAHLPPKAVATATHQGGLIAHGDASLAIVSTLAGILNAAMVRVCPRLHTPCVLDR